MRMANSLVLKIRTQLTWLSSDLSLPFQLEDKNAREIAYTVQLRKWEKVLETKTTIGPKILNRVNSICPQINDISANGFD